MPSSSTADAAPDLTYVRLPHGTAARLTSVAAAVLLAVVGVAVIASVGGSEGVSASVVLPIAAALAVALVGLAASTALSSAARWGAVFVLGQAAGLLLVNAGPTLHYQHLRPLGELARGAVLPLLIVAAQGAVVTVATWRRAPVIGAWIRERLGYWRAALLLGVLVALSATVNADVRAYAGELALGSVLQLIGVLNLILVGMSIPDRSLAAVGRLVDRVAGAYPAAAAVDGGGADRFAWTLAALTTVTAALLSVFVYERHPHVQDEVKYLFQARYFAAGYLALPVPAVPKAFEMYLIDVGPRGWYSVVPPGWAAVLALGVRLGAGWLVNPVLTGVNVVLAYVLLRSLYPRRTARAATLLLALSPMHIFLGMSYMAHAVTLTCALLGALAVQRVRRTGEIWPTLLGGVAVGFSATVRQLDGLIVALALGLWCLGLAGSRVRLASTLALVVGTVLGVAPLLPYNAYFTGRGGTFPIMAYHDRLFWPNANAYGFGPDRGMGWGLDPNPGHSLFDAAVNANLNATTLNVELFGWGVGSLLLIAFLLTRGRLTRPDRGMLFVALLTVAAYVPNYFSGGPDFGARYWFPMLLPVVVLTVRGFQELATRVGPRGGLRVAAVSLVLGITSVGVFMPWRSVDKYHRYLGMRPDVRAMVHDPSFARSLVFVEGREQPDYLSAAIYNPLDLRADEGTDAPIFVHDVDAKTRLEVLQAFPDRPVVVVRGPSLTGRGYVVVRRASSGRQLLAHTTP